MVATFCTRLPMSLPTTPVLTNSSANRLGKKCVNRSIFIVRGLLYLARILTFVLLAGRARRDSHKDSRRRRSEPERPEPRRRGGYLVRKTTALLPQDDR